MSKLILWIALGPVSGPLCALAYNAARARHYGRATFFLALLVSFYALSPVLLTWELSHIH